MKFWSMSQHRETTADDPERFVWYSSGCTYWTDDIDKLRNDEGIFRVNGRTVKGGPPTCPRCGAVGFQTEARKYLDPAAIAAHEAKAGNEDYGATLAWMKERCFPSWRAAFEARARNWEKP